MHKRTVLKIAATCVALAAAAAPFGTAHAPPDHPFPTRDHRGTNTMISQRNVIKALALGAAAAALLGALGSAQAQTKL